MRKAGLAIVILLFTQFALASFPKPGDSLQASLPDTQKAVSTLSNKTVKSFEHITTSRPLFFTRKPGLKLLMHQLRRQKKTPRQSGWILFTLGFLLGFFLGPIGFGIVYITSKNKTFRKGAVNGLEGFTILLYIYILAVIALLTLFVLLGFGRVE